MIQRALIYIFYATLMMQVEAPNLHNQSKTHTLVDCFRLLMANKYNDDGPMRFCLPNDDHEYRLVYQKARRVDSGDCPYINKLQGNFDTRKCNPNLGICPNNSYVLSNGMYSKYNACFPTSSTTTTTTGNDTTTTTTGNDTTTTTTGYDTKSKDSNSSAVVMTLGIIMLYIIGIAICIAIGIIIGNESKIIKEKYHQMKKCCCGICSKKTPEETHTAEGLEQTQMLGSSGTSSDLQVDIRVEDGGGHALAKTQPAAPEQKNICISKHIKPT